MQSRDDDGGGGSTRSESTGLEHAHESAGAIDRKELGLWGPPRLDVHGDAPVALGRYRIGPLIGEGGMGSVFEGYDRELDRAVAIKVIRRDRVRPRAQHRLKSEAEVMAKVAHPNVLTVLDVGEDEGEVFVVLERVVGESMARWLDGGRGNGEIMERFLAAARGLGAAHERGIVHGDFKPSNVLLAEDGRVLLADFGLAHPVDDDASAGGRAGTPRFMAPEVGRNESATQASDQFSFGIALLEALGGTRNAAGRPTLPPAVRRSNRSLEQQLARMVARDPAERFPSMTEVVSALQRSPWRRRAPWLALPLLAAPVAWLGAREPAPPDPCAAIEVAAVKRDAQDLVARARGNKMSGLASKGHALMSRAETSGCPAAIGEVGTAVGEALARGAELDAADRVLQRSFLVAIEAGDDRARARSAIQLATLHGVRRGDGGAAQDWLRHARAGAQAVGDAELEALVEQAYGAVALRSRAFEAAETHLRSALLKAGPQADPAFRGGARANLAIALASQLRLDEALEELAAAAVALKGAPQQAASLVAVLTNRASMLRQVGRVPEALAGYLQALEHAERLHGAPHTSVATLHVNLGQLALLTNDHARALAHMRTAVEIRVAVLGEGDTQTARAHHGLGQAELALGRVDDAERSFIRAREVLALASGEALSCYPEVGLAQVDLARGDVAAALRRLDTVRPVIANGGPWFSRAEAYRATARAHLANGDDLKARGFEFAAVIAYSRAGPAYYGLARDGLGGPSTASIGVSGSNL